MIKVTIIGEAQPIEKKKPIEFVKWVNTTIDRCEIDDSTALSKSFENIELISKGRDGEYDIMWAYDSNRAFGCLYLGHFNDGIVEGGDYE